MFRSKIILTENISLGNRKTRNFTIGIQVQKCMFYMISSKIVFSLIFYVVFDQKIVPKMFSTKIILERKIFDFIEKFCIRRVMKKCFSPCIADVSSVRKLCECT